MNGPNIIERMFGIDAGGKGGMAALAGAYAIGKGATDLHQKERKVLLQWLTEQWVKTMGQR
ncbi:hypothetical protein [Sinobaca sp. H24]|uniref:hypothetical protein n=1 Tax=Sinobaca sp. H24 TaxID=2923376 RepID=UPI00207A65F6|nr:hypothetical protein [Sinobaca sp. H24]